MKQDAFDTVCSHWERERPDLDSRGLEVAWRIQFLHKDLKRELGDRLAELELPDWAYDVLASLRRQGRPYAMSPTELARLSHLTTGAMTNRLDRLERRELVERRPHPDDRRGLQVQLTRTGKRLVDRALDIRFEHANQAMSVLSETERVRLVKLLRKLVAARVGD